MVTVDNLFPVAEGILNNILHLYFPNILGQKA